MQRPHLVDDGQEVDGPGEGFKEEGSKEVDGQEDMCGQDTFLLTSFPLPKQQLCPAPAPAWTPQANG